MQTEKVQTEISQWQERMKDSQAELARCEAQKKRLEEQSNELLLKSFDDPKVRKQISDIEAEQIRFEKEHRRLTATVAQIETKLHELDDAMADAKDQDAGAEQESLYQKMIELAPQVDEANDRVLKLNQEFVALIVRFDHIDRVRKNKLSANVRFWHFWFETKHHPHVHGALNGDQRRQFQVPLADLVTRYLGKFFSEKKAA